MLWYPMQDLCVSNVLHDDVFDRMGYLFTVVSFPTYPFEVNFVDDKYPAFYDREKHQVTRTTGRCAGWISRESRLGLG